MIKIKKRWNYLCFILLFIALLSISALAENAYFYWYDAGGTLCKTTNAGAVADTGKTSDSDTAPYNDTLCCDVEGPMSVKYCTDIGCTSTISAYNVSWDTNQVDCECYGKIWNPSVYFESQQPACCGDDANEYYITQGVGAPACMACPATATACVSSANKCRNEFNQEVSCHDGLDNDCDDKSDCSDINCKTGTETNIVDGIDVGCRDGIDNDCDGLTDCSDPDCSLSLDCIGCLPESQETNCEDGLDNDCDSYVDCVLGNADSDCVNSGLCDGCTVEVCTGNADEDCDGKVDCADEDCFERCGGTCVAENTDALCSNGIDDDCDTFIDYLDRDCQGCGMGKKTCSDGSCKETCDPAVPQGCVGTANSNCEEGEGCACADCFGKRDSCERELVCNLDTNACSCPSGTTMCSDNRCRKKCFVCGDDILEEGEECDGGTTACTSLGLTGDTPVSCVDCAWDTSVCVGQTCDPANADDEYCCVIKPDDGECDPECTANADTDCTACTPWLGDCCEDKKDGQCDYDCISYKDPDCGVEVTCSNDKDGCCNNANDQACDPDCDTSIDPDCGTCSNNGGDCCNNNQDDVCDPDCIIGVDPDCKCGNKIIDSGETCDTANLGSKTCAIIFGADYGGILACFGIDSENPCHFDTSGCHKIPDICIGGSCSFGKDCRCPECVGEQSSCNYGSICDSTSKCACIDGTTLCKDSTCRTPQNCEAYGTGEQKCTTQNNVCDPGEGCGCQDCEDKKGPCNQLSVCKNGQCTGCFLERAYWADVNTEKEEDCIGSGNDIKMIVEGTPGCEEKTVKFKLEEPSIDLGNAVFKNSKAELVWPKEKVITRPGEDESFYDFEAILEGEEKITSEPLKVEFCVNECDADCDSYCENDPCPTAPDGYCKLKEGEIILDANALSDWCEECDPDGLAEGQETCAAYYDCTPGWWGSSTPEGWDEPVKQDAMNYLEWGECGDPKVDPYPTDWNRQKVSGNMRNRLICPEKDSSGNTILKNQCCDYPDQASCYCKIPTQMPPGMNCNLPQFRPTEIKACLAEEKFPFFTNMNILIVVLILTGFYIWKNREKAKIKR